MEFGWNEERAALDAKAQQLREELSAATACMSATAEPAAAPTADPGAQDGVGVMAAGVSLEEAVGLRSQLEGYVAQVAALQQQLAGLEGVGARGVAELEVLRGEGCSEADIGDDVVMGPTN